MDYDEREHLLVFKQLPLACNDWIVDALERRVPMADGAVDLLRWLREKQLVDESSIDTELEHEPSCSTSDTAIL